MNLQKKQQIVGSRLDEIIRSTGKSNRELSLTINNLYKDIKTAPSVISRVRNGTSSLPQHYIKPLAKLLKIDAGYLTGEDDFKAENYEHYLKLMDKVEKVTQYAPDLQRKINMFDFAGYTCNVNFNAEVSVDKNICIPFSITIADSNKSASISYNQIEDIEAKIRSYAVALIDVAIQQNQIKSFDSPEDFQKAWKKINK